MGASEPTDEQVGGFGWRLPIERHQCRRAACEADKIRTPAVGSDGADLNLVDVSVYGLFESVCGHDIGLRRVRKSTRYGKRRFYRAHG